MARVIKRNKRLELQQFFEKTAEMLKIKIEPEEFPNLSKN